ncbi:MAG: DUF2341 domain-containing protein, partial [Candidatus Hodarchaeales archaeon]
MSKRKFTLQILILTTFLMNVTILAIPVQNEDFYTSDHIFLSMLKGIGLEPRLPGNFHQVPKLTKDTIIDEINQQSISGNTNFKLSDYYVPGWADSRWQYRKNITIDSSKVNTDLANFAVYIDLYDTELPQDAQASGNDIFFTDTQGNLLDHEIELYERVYNSSHAHLVAWVKANISSTQNTILSMYYGNPIAENQENPTAVWDENYVGVWHLSEEKGAALDSTSYGTSGGITGGVTQNTISQLGRGYDFDGTSGTTVDFGDPIDDHLDFGLGNYTISFWYNVDQSIGNYQMPLYKGGSSNGISGYEFETSFAAETLSFYSGDGTQTYSCGWADITYDAWHYVVGINDRLADYLRIYQDSVNIGNSDISSLGNVDSAYHLVLSPNTYPFDGMIDEVRLSKSIRSVGWIQTEYNNQKDPTTFYSVGTKEGYGDAEEWALPALKYRKNVTVLANQVSGSGNLVDFPVLVDLYDPDLHSSDKVQTNGEDIVFLDTSGTQLSHELELFDQNYNSTHAHLIAWVRVPSLSGISNTTISMYYGNNVLASQENREGVWDSNYAGIWHLSETSGGSLAIKDSTTNYNDGTDYGTVELGASGQIYGSIGIDAYEDYISIADSSSLNITTDLTISVWTKADYYQYSLPIIAKDEAPNSPYAIWYINNSNQIAYNLEGVTTSQVDSGVTANREAWMYVVLTYDGSSVNIYTNGTLEYSVSKPGTITSNNQPLQFGREEFWGDTYRGYIDEVRISDSIRSSDWISTEYNNQYNPDNFYVVTDEEEFRHWFSDASFDYRKDILIDHAKVKGESQVLTLRPNGVGHVTFLSVSGATDNYEAVDEVNYDTSTYVYRIQSGGFWGVDYYQTENAPIISDSAINSVTIKFRGIKNAGAGMWGRTQIYTYSQYINGDEPSLGSSYANVYSQEYLTNPYTGEAWTWTEINDMEIGVGLKGFMVADEGRVTQLWAEVNYTKNEDLSNFPILVDITSNDFKSGKIQPDAADLLFTDVNGTKLFHEIEYFS